MLSVLLKEKDSRESLNVTALPVSVVLPTVSTTDFVTLVLWAHHLGLHAYSQE